MEGTQNSWTVQRRAIARKTIQDKWRPLVKTKESRALMKKVPPTTARRPWATPIAKASREATRRVTVTVVRPEYSVEGLAPPNA